MANEGSYQYAAPGGVASPSHSIYMRRYREPSQIDSSLRDFVTFGDIMTTVKENPIIFGAIGLGVGLWLWGKG